jgi:hypothetical protein
MPGSALVNITELRTHLWLVLCQQNQRNTFYAAVPGMGIAPQLHIFLFECVRFKCYTACFPGRAPMLLPMSL